MNRNRNQRVVLYSGGKFDHVVQEGNEPAYTKKMAGKKKQNKYGKSYIR